MFWVPDILRAMQAFMLGTTGFLGWRRRRVARLRVRRLPGGGRRLGRALDALALGETTAASLGMPLGAVRVALVGVHGAGHRRGRGAGRA